MAVQRQRGRKDFLVKKGGNMMNKHPYVKLIMLLLVVGLVAGSKCGNGNGNGNGGTETKTIKADAGGPYSIFCGNQQVLDGTKSYAEAGIDQNFVTWTPIGDSWESGGELKPGATPLTPVFHAPSCAGLGKTKVYDLSLTIRDTKGREDTDYTQIYVSEKGYGG